MGNSGFELGQLLERARMSKKMGFFMGIFDAILTVMFLLSGQMFSALILALCTFSMYHIYNKGVAQEAEILEMLEENEPNRKTTTKVEDLYPPK